MLNKLTLKMRNGDVLQLDTDKISGLGTMTNEKTLTKNTVLICDGVMLMLNTENTYDEIAEQLEFQFKFNNGVNNYVAI